MFNGVIHLGGAMIHFSANSVDDEAELFNWRLEVLSFCLLKKADNPFYLITMMD